nr:glutathione S-transferase GSTS6/7-6 [Brachionus angularis]
MIPFILLLIFALNKFNYIDCVKTKQFMQCCSPFEVPIYTLNYFDMGGQAEFLRFILAEAGQPYIDNRIPIANWPALRPIFPFEQLPVLEIQQGEYFLVLAHPLAISRYLAQSFDLNGRNPTETALIDMYGSQMGELHNNISNHASSNLTGEFIQTWNKNLGFFERRLEKNRYGYLVGSKLSWADLYLSQLTEFLKDEKTRILERYPRVKQLDLKVRSSPRISEWIKKRTVTEL